MMPATAPSASVDPIISRLRPRTVTEILDQSFRLYRKHFLTFLAITAVVFVPVNIVIQGLTVYLQGTSREIQNYTTSGDVGEINSAQMNEMLVALLIGYGALMVLAIIGSILMYLSQGALTSAVADSHLDQEVSFRRAYRSTFQRIGPLVGVMVLQILIGIAIFVPIILLFVCAISALVGSAINSDAGGAGAVGAMCFAFLLIIPAFAIYAYVFVRLSLVVPAVMVENLGPRQALSRSWELVRDYWWRTFAIILVLGLISAVVSAGPALLLISIITLITRNFDQFVVDTVAGGVTVLSSLIFTPLQLIAMTLYYFDQRVRKEGFDIETAMGQRYGPYGPLQPAYGGSYGSGYDAYGQPQQFQQTQPQPGAAAPPNLGYGPPASPYDNPYGQQQYSPPGAYEPGSGQPTQPQDTPPSYTQLSDAETVNLGSPGAPTAGESTTESPPSTPPDGGTQGEEDPTEPRTGDYPPQGPAVAQDDTPTGRGQA